MNAVGRLLLGRRAVDHDFVAAHTEGFGAYRDFLLRADWEGLVSAAGVPEAPIRALADRVTRSGAMLTFYCQGLNQSTVGMWRNNSTAGHALAGARAGELIGADVGTLQQTFLAGFRGSTHGLSHGRRDQRRRRARLRRRSR
jgi:hypothetical protein